MGSEMCIRDSACDITEIFQEGVRIPPLKIFENDKPSEVFFKLMRTNVRVPQKVLGDINSQIAACRRGERGFLELVERYGFENLKAQMKDLLDYSEELTRAELSSLPDGEWEFEDFMDDDGFDPDPIRLHCKLTKKKDEILIDFRESSKQVKGSIKT